MTRPDTGLLIIIASTALLFLIEQTPSIQEDIFRHSLLLVPIGWLRGAWLIVSPIVDRFDPDPWIERRQKR